MPYLPPTLLRQRAGRSVTLAIVLLAIASMAAATRHTVSHADVAGLLQSASTADAPPTPLAVPRRAKLNVRMLTAVEPGTAQLDDRIDASTVAELVVGQRVLIPKGTLVRGRVTEAEAAKGNKPRRLTVKFDALTMNFQAYAIKATLVDGLTRELSVGALVDIRFE